MRIHKQFLSFRGFSYLVLLCGVLFLLTLSSKQQAAPAAVTVTEFSDFQCPYCKRAASVVEQLRQSYGDKVKFVFKQMPLPMHKQAFKAAQASVCAGEQGKFWEYHDRLFAGDDLSVDVLNRTSAEVGLNVAAFSQCLESQASRAMVEKDIAEAERLGVRGTPTFFVDGEAITGAATLAALKRKIDGVLTEGSTQPRQSGTTTRSPQVGTGSNSDRVNSASTSASRADIASPKGASPNTKDQQQAASTTTTAGVTLSPATIDFGYQLVGTTSTQIVETVTNSGNAPLVITDISVSGRDRNDFIPGYSFTLPVTVARGDSISVNLSFIPALPWRRGTRSARLEMAEKKTSLYVSLTGIGATCGGPVPACASGCADADGDGLNDAWEIADGIDFDNDGLVDFQFPHADFTAVKQSGGGTGMVLTKRTTLTAPVTASSIAVTINSPGNVGTATFSYTQDGSSPVGPLVTSRALDIPGNIQLEFANGQVNPSFMTGTTYSFLSGNFKLSDKDTPNIYVQYDYMDWTTTPGHACNVDTDCAGGGGELFGERCHLGYCNHNHDPDAAAPGAISKVVQAYAAHGIRLYIDPVHQALPHSNVVSWRTPQLACEGADVAERVVGAYAVNYLDLKKFSSDHIGPGFDAKRKLIYHYGIFAHYSGCDFDAFGTHCALCPSAGDAARSGQPSPGQSGMAELPGNDFIVSLGHWANDQNHPSNLFQIGGTFMHELGHNFGLRHGGDADGPNYKPNYLSVMNYNFQMGGIASTDALPADPVLGVQPNELNLSKTRLDYSHSTLRTLDEVFDGVTHFGLDESLGLACPPPDALSVFTFTNDNGETALGSCTGPVNWDMNSDVIGTNLQQDLNQGDHLGSVVHTQLTGHTDWGPSFIAAMPFQCSEWGSADGAAPFENTTTGELTPELAVSHHVLYPPRAIDIEITPGCEDKIINPGRRGEFSVALLGANDLDVRDVEPTSLRFHGATAVRTELSDINGDGKLDLLIVFDQAGVSLDPRTKVGRLTGWLKSSQLFIGNDRVNVL